MIAVGESLSGATWRVHMEECPLCLSHPYWVTVNLDYSIVYCAFVSMRSDCVECALPAFVMFTFPLMMLYCFELNDVSILQYLEGSNSSFQYGTQGQELVLVLTTKVPRWDLSVNKKA